MTSKPSKLGLFGFESLSALFPGVDSSSTEASQPRTKQSWKKRRMMSPGVPGSSLKALVTIPRTTFSALGHNSL